MKIPNKNDTLVFSCRAIFVFKRGKRFRPMALDMFQQWSSPKHL